MKTNCLQTNGPVHTKTRHSSRVKINPGSLFPALLLAGALLLGPGGGVQRCAAGTGFPTVVTNGTTFSIAVVQVVVDPSFAFLFAPAPSYFSYYPGYGGPSNSILTGPVMFDFQTVIGESTNHVRNSVSPTYFPVAAGTGTGPANYPPPNQSYSNILSYADYPYVPPLFTNGMNGHDEIMTEIEQMNLVGYVDHNSGLSNGTPCIDPRVPSSSDLATVTVKAGPGGLGISASLPFNRRSIGMVQQITVAPNDFPAQSFFDVFVEVSLPRVPGTIANTAFPFSGAVLYNDASNPLLIQALSITNLPPEVTYVHGLSSAVPIRFRDNNPPYWMAGDVMGYLTLAGHGMITNVVTASSPCASAMAPGGLLDVTLGPIGSPIVPPPIPWLRTTNTFPTPGSGLASLVNRPVDTLTGQTNYLDEVVSFFGVNGLNTVYLRNVNFGSFSGSIPPPISGIQTFSQASTAMKCEFSMDGVNYYPVTASGGISMTISNTLSGGMYSTEITAMNFNGTINGGQFSGVALGLRESPTIVSKGKTIIAPDPRGWRISSFFDVFTEISIDTNPNYTPASKSLRVQATMPAPMPQSIFVTQISKTNIVLNWQNNLTLQGATDLRGPWADVPGPVLTGPYTNTIGTETQAKFFRTRQ